MAYQYQTPTSQPTGLEKFGDFIRKCGYAITAILLAYVALNVVILVLGAALVIPQISSEPYVVLFLVIPFIVGIAVLTGPVAAAYYVFIVVAIVASYIWMARRSLPTLRQELAMERVPQHSVAYVVATLFCATIAATYIGYYIGAIFIPTPTVINFDDTPLWQVLYDLANASVWEELISRVLLIGIPLLVIGIATREKRPAWRYILGGEFEFGKKEVFFVLFSSSMFGLGHYFGGWDIIKIAPAMIGGFAMGYLFLKFGLYASIMLHFFTDYSSISYFVSGKNEFILSIIDLMLLACVIIGIAYLVHYALKGLSALTGQDLRLEKPIAAPAGLAPLPQPPQQNQYQPPVMQMPPTQGGFDVFCHSCGSREAKYENGQLICAHCGRQL
jgi:hypothetical protein